MAAGGVQALLKAHRSVAGKRAAVAGTGPFLLPVTAVLVGAVAEVVAVCEAGSMTGWGRSPIGAVALPSKGLEVLEFAATFACHRIPAEQRQSCAFIDQMREKGHAVESICRVLSEQGCQVAARTYRAWRSAPPPAARGVSDAIVINALKATVGNPESLYGRRQMVAHLRRQRLAVAHCTVDRLMADLGMKGVLRAKSHRTTVPGKDGKRAEDLVDRDFTAAISRPTAPRVATASHAAPQPRRCLGAIRVRSRCTGSGES